MSCICPKCKFTHVEEQNGEVVCHDCATSRERVKKKDGKKVWNTLTGRPPGYQWSLVQKEKITAIDGEEPKFGWFLFKDGIVYSITQLAERSYSKYCTTCFYPRPRTILSETLQEAAQKIFEEYIPKNPSKKKEI